jgi:hypothetical protein
MRSDEFIGEIDAAEDIAGYNIVERCQPAAYTMHLKHGCNGISSDDDVDSPGFQDGFMLHGIVRSDLQDQFHIANSHSLLSQGFVDNGLVPVVIAQGNLFSP